MNIEQKMERAWNAFDRSEEERKLSASSDARSFPPFPSVDIVREWRAPGSETPSMYRTIRGIMSGALDRSGNPIDIFRTYN